MNINDKKKLIVGFIGTANTGKTTLINDIMRSEENIKRDKNMQWTTFGKDYRDVIAERKLKINREGNAETQKIIHETLLGNIKDALNEPMLKRILLDRTVIDSFVYTYWHLKYGGNEIGISREILEKMWYDVVKWSRMYDRIIYVPLDKCKDIITVEDGVRDTDETYRKQIDGIFYSVWLLLSGIAYMDVIYGSRKERVDWFFNQKEYLMTHDLNNGYKTFSEFENLMNKRYP